MPANAGAADAAVITRKLKESLELVERLRSRRKELKSLLAKDGASEVDEEKLATELAAVSKAIRTTEDARLAIYAECANDEAKGKGAK